MSDEDPKKKIREGCDCGGAQESVSYNPMREQELSRLIVPEAWLEKGRY